jgi:hypothetical protein
MNMALAELVHREVHTVHHGTMPQGRHIACTTRQEPSSFAKGRARVENWPKKIWDSWDFAMNDWNLVMTKLLGFNWITYEKLE